jgi:hypothetical protein
MTNLELRLIALLVALVATAFLTGGGWYEQAVLDSAGPKKPAIVRPAEGGANRKLFWVPANILAVAALLAALWASWPAPGARAAMLAAVGFYAVINVVTFGFFGPAVLRVEKSGVAPHDPASIRPCRTNSNNFSGINRERGNSRAITFIRFSEDHIGAPSTVSRDCWAATP